MISIGVRKLAARAQACSPYYEKLLEAYTATLTPIVSIKICMISIGVRKLAAKAQASRSLYCHIDANREHFNQYDFDRRQKACSKSLAKACNLLRKAPGSTATLTPIVSIKI